MGQWKLDAGPVVFDLEDQPVGHDQSHFVAARLCVLACVGQALAHDGEDMVAHVLGHGVVHCSFESHLGTAPEVWVPARRTRCTMAWRKTAGQRGVPQLEDGRADLGDGVVELVDGFGDPLDDQVAFGQARRTLEAHADGVNALNDPVVQVPGDAIPVVEHAHDPDPVVEPGVLNGDAGGECEGLGERLVLVGERRSHPLCRSGRGCRRRRLGRAAGRPRSEVMGGCPGGNP